MTDRRIAAAGLIATGAWLAWRSRPGVDLTDKVALVTGGSRGLGFLLAEELLRQGCRVAICGRDAETLERARVELRRRTGTGSQVLTVPCDVADPEAAEALVAEVVATFGALDVLVNNAGVIQVAPLESLRREDFEKAMAIIYGGTVNTTLAALPHLRLAHGRIANITSIGGKVAVPHLLPYDAAKFATVGFSEGLRSELAGSGVRVTTVVPGLMRTGSPVHVPYGGNAPAEYLWFAAGDLTPLTAMNATRAARAIIAATRRGRAEIVLTWQAKLLRIGHALAPGTTTRVLGLVNRMLPDAEGRARQEALGVSTDRSRRWVRGREMDGALPGPLESALKRTGARSNE